MNKKILMTLAVALMMVTGAAQAQTDRAGDIALFYTDAFSSGNSLANVDPNLGIVSGEDAAMQPTYHLGYFVTDDIMPYAGFYQQNWGGGTATLIRGGARFYGVPLDRGDVRTFADGEMFIFLSNGPNDSIGLGGFAGVEYMMDRHFSVSARVGLRVTDNDNANSQVSFGTADLSLNFYF